MHIFKNIYDFYRVGHWFTVHKIPVIPKLLSIAERIIFPECDYSFPMHIGKNAQFPYGAIGCGSHYRAVVGDNVIFYPKAVIAGKDEGAPVIGDNCILGTGCCIMGNVKIGNNCIIGAGAVVAKDVPDNKVVVGIPARILKDVPVENIEELLL